MNPFRYKTRMVVAVLSLSIFSFAPLQAGGLFHAAEKSAARRIMAKGFNPAKFKANARFGKGLYLAKRPSTALAEKGTSRSVIRLKEKPLLKKKSIDFRNPTGKKLRQFLGKKYDLRGSVKKKTIGPRAGRKIGKIAGNNKKAIMFRSSRNGGTNIFIPKKTYREFPNMVRPEKMIGK